MDNIASMVSVWFQKYIHALGGISESISSGWQILDYTVYVL
jgi:hypothetical protein